jgi:type IV pilus assembly protein PilE
MIVVIVLGILAAIVVPSYQQYIRQSHRGKADLWSTRSVLSATTR